MVACKNNTESASNQDPFDSANTLNLTEIIEDTSRKTSEETIEKVADSSLSRVLPDEIYDYIADLPKNTDLTLSDENFYQSVVKIYRKDDKMIGINIMDLSKFKDKELTISSSFQALESLYQNNKSTSDLENFKIKKGIKGIYFYSAALKKAVILINAYERYFISISSDTTLDEAKFKDITNQIRFDGLKKLY